MTKFVQVLLQTLTLGSLYALIALGYTLVYGILRFINFAHSDVFTFGAWIAFVIAGALGWAGTGSPVFALPVVMILAMASAAAPRLHDRAARLPPAAQGAAPERAHHRHRRVAAPAERRDSSSSCSARTR
jgi:branched-subunit amino acid ABC-type transport system permease component